MRSLRTLALVAGIALLIGGCGGDAATDTTAATTTTTTTTTAAPTTTSAGASTTTTTAATTTAATLPADAHPVFGLGWEEVWPAPDATATYRVTTFEGEQIDLPAVMEYGVEFEGGTYDRLVVGTPEPGNDAMVVYFDRSDPWQVAIVGEEIFAATFTTGPESVYLFEMPVVFDGFAPIGETRRTEGRLTVAFRNDVFEPGVTYDVTLRGIETVTVPAGEFDDVLVVDIEVGGELMGGDFVFPLEIWFEADNLFINYTGASGFDVLELLVPWA